MQLTAYSGLCYTVVMLIDYTRYRDYSRLADIFRTVKQTYDIEQDLQDFRVEDWTEQWQSGSHSENAPTYSYDIYNRFVSREPPARWRSIVQDISSLSGISYSAVIVVPPHSVMPEHTDWSHIEGMSDDHPDRTYTIMYYLSQPRATERECGMQWGNKRLYLPEDSILCLDGGRVPHSVYNHTDQQRVTFCLSVLETSFDL